VNIIQKAANPITTPNIWDPYRAMREAMRWNPIAEMQANIEGTGLLYNPEFEVLETKEGYQFRADLPGIKEKDLEISITGNRLSVSGHREAEKRDESDRYYLYERSYGSFTRSFTLPEGIDNTRIIAELKNGVLQMLVPRRPEAQPHKIALKAGH
jgi:HSP20 family protein